MHSLNRRGRLRRSALAALFLGVLPLPLLAQIRRPDPVPANPRKAGVNAKHRSEFLFGGGIVPLSDSNGTKGQIFVGSVGYRRQVAREWLSLGASVDFGRTSVNGEFFPYEKRPVGDTIQYVVVNGNATMVAGRFTADVLWPIGEDDKYRAGFGANGGVYAMLPSPGGSTFVAPTFGASFVGQADITPRIGVQANLGFAQFTGFDREKLRPSDPALADPVFRTPLIAPPDAVKSFGGVRAILSVTYRLGIRKSTGGKK